MVKMMRRQSAVKLIAALAVALLAALCAHVPGAYADDALGAGAASDVLGAQSVIDEATAVDFGKWYSKTRGADDDWNTHYYGFELNASGCVSVRYVSDDSGVEFSLRKSTGGKLSPCASDKNLENGCDITETYDLMAGSYYVEFSHPGNSYRFRADFTSAQESFPESTGGNNNAVAKANAITLGQAYCGQLAANDGVDYYSFKTTGSGIVRVTASSNMGRTTYRLCDAYGELIATKKAKANSFTGRQSLSWTYDLGKGNYILKVVRSSSENTGPYEFKVEELPDIEDAVIGPIGEQEYTGKAIKPLFEVTIGGSPLTFGADYDVAFENNVNAGTAKVKLTGKGGCTGTKEFTFEIKPADIAAAKVSSIGNKSYTGEVIEPSPTVTLNGRKLTEGTDYALSYKRNRNAGMATVQVTGEGNYAGSVAAKFRIVPAAQKISAKNCSATVHVKIWGNTLETNKTVKLKSKAKVSAKTKVTYKKANKVGGSKISVNKKTGVVTLKKGLKYGEYNVQVKLTAPKSKNYKAAAAKTITLKVWVV